MSNPIPKHRYLQSLSNIDIAQRAKKVITTPTRPAATKTAQKPKRASAQNMPVAVLFSQPIVVDTPVPVITPPKTRVRRMYDRDFLLKFKYTAIDFPPGVQTPEEIMAQYNKDFEVKERLAALELAASRSSQVEKPVSESAKPVVPSYSKAIPDTKKPKREKEIKIHSTASAASVSRLPMFASKSSPSTPVSAKGTVAQADKENMGTASPVTPAKKVKKTHTTSPAPITAALKPASPQFQSSIETTESSPVAAPEVKPQPVATTTTAADVEDLSKKLKAALKEADPRRLAQRQKQIDYGKNTVGYSKYIDAVPKTKRKREDPKTPNKLQICSKRSWDGQIRKWRRQLHFYDPAGTPLDDGLGVGADDAEVDTDSETDDVGANDACMTCAEEVPSSVGSFASVSNEIPAAH